MNKLLAEISKLLIMSVDENNVGCLLPAGGFSLKCLYANSVASRPRVYTGLQTDKSFYSKFCFEQCDKCFQFFVVNVLLFGFVKDGEKPHN